MDSSFKILVFWLLIFFQDVQTGRKRNDEQVSIRRPVSKLERYKASDLKSFQFLRDLLSSFPHGIELKRMMFKNWSNEIDMSVWTTYPKSVYQILDIVNWARYHDVKVHASGQRYSWAPLTVNTDNADVILISTENLKNMGIVSNTTGDSSFWAEPGILIEDMLKHLEEASLTISSIPVVGKITLGGALAVSTHGGNIPGQGEVLQPGHSYGSLSNLIISFTAVVYNSELDMYTLKKFNRSDSESSAFLTNLGRSIITNVTLRAGPLQWYQCLSIINIPARELFALSGPKTFTSILEGTGRAEIIWNSFSNYPWLKVWNLTSTKPNNSREVTSPYNYPFAESYINMMDLEFLKGIRPQTTFLARLNANYVEETIRRNLISQNSKNIWGTARNTFLVFQGKTFRHIESGHVIITSRDSIQRVLSEFYEFFIRLIERFESQEIFPNNGAVVIRVTGLDHPEQVLVQNATTPAFSFLSPVPDRPNWDVAVSVSVTTLPRTPGMYDFYCELEQFYLKHFNSNWSVVRPEWSKGWAFTRKATWSNRSFLRELKRSGKFYGWDEAAKVLKNYDPFDIFSGNFTKQFV